MDITTTLNDLLKILQEDFYQRLLAGKIREAKASAHYIRKTLLDLHARQY